MTGGRLSIGRLGGQRLLEHWLPMRPMLDYQWSLPFRSEAGRPMHALSYILFPLK